GVQVAPMISGGIKKSDLVAVCDTMISAEKSAEIKSKITKITTKCDVLIIGGRPAGLTAGLYLCQSKINTILIDIQLPGGQVTTTHQLSNYPRFMEPKTRNMLSHHMSEQTRLCGTQNKVAVDVANVNLHNKTVEIDAFETIKAKN